MKAIHGYVHHDKSFGILVEFEVGTDFTTRTPEFKTLAEQVAMAFGLNDLPDSKDLPEDTFVPSENSTPEEKLAFRIEFTRML
jgi:translation elongation factor EF-Ts